MSYCVCDYERPSVISERTRRARKPHKCIECGREISPGETYEYTWGIWEGDADQFKTCSRCLAVKQYVMAHVPCFCWTYGNLLDDARSCIGEYAGSVPGMRMEFGRLLVRAIRGRREAGR